MDKKDFHELMVARARYSEIRLRARLDTVKKMIGGKLLAITIMT